MAIARPLLMSFYRDVLDSAGLEWTCHLDEYETQHLLFFKEDAFNNY
jgi:hypothetical protein